MVGNHAMTVGMCWLLLMVSYGELRGVKAQDAEGKDWFEVEVTLANSDFVDGDEGWEVIGEAAGVKKTLVFRCLSLFCSILDIF